METKRKAVFGVMLTLLFMSMFATFNVQAVDITGPIYIRADGSVDPPTAPILRSGDTYTLYADIKITQNDGIIIQKSGVTLDGAGYTLEGGSIIQGAGIMVSKNVAIKNIRIKGFYSGIDMGVQGNNTVMGSIITNNANGIILSYNLAYDNRVIENIVTDNLGFGILVGSSNSSIVGNTVVNNTYGIYLNLPNNCSITGNSIRNSDYGMFAAGADNSIYHNNFENNTNHVYSYGAWNVWDNGYPSGGNFWSNYTGTDLNGDGIGDTPHVIDADNQDRYPLITPTVWDHTTPIPVVWAGTVYRVPISTNSTIAAFRFNQTWAQISFNIIGTTGTIGFSNVTIPKKLLWVEPLGQWLVFADGLPVTPIVTEDTENTYLYFTYSHSTKTIQIIGTNVVPEFPPATIVSLLTILTLLAIVFAKRRFPRKPKT